MKPAPPVTSNLLCIADLRKHASQALTPVKRRYPERDERPGVENTIGRPARRRRVLVGCNRNYSHVGGHQPETRALLLDRHRKVVPGSRACIGPMIDAADLRQRDELP